MTIFWLWTLVGLVIAVVAALAWVTGLVTSRQMWVACIVGDALRMFGAIVTTEKLSALIIAAWLAYDVWQWTKARDDDDDQKRKRRLKSKARSHLPRPVIRRLRPVETS